MRSREENCYQFRSCSRIQNVRQQPFSFTFPSFHPAGEVGYRNAGSVEGVDRRVRVGVAKRHAADQHLFGPCPDVGQDELRKAVPRGLRAGMQAARAQQAVGKDVAAFWVGAKLDFIHRDKIGAFESQRLATKPWLAHTMVPGA